MNITRWYTKVCVNRHRPVVWVGFLFKFCHRVFILNYHSTTKAFSRPKKDGNTIYDIKSFWVS
jgi:hypothetical protein